MIRPLIQRTKKFLPIGQIFPPTVAEIQKNHRFDKKCPDFIFRNYWEMAIKESFGEHIRKLREENGLPLRKVAAVLDIDPSTLSKIERGERSANKEMLPGLAELFKEDTKTLGLIL